MDYLASEMSMTNRCLEEISNQLGYMTKEPVHKTHSRREIIANPFQTSLDHKKLSNKFKIEDIDKIPLDTFVFECIQEIQQYKGDTKEWRRYELNPQLEKPFSHYLVLAYSIIQKDLKIEGYCPTEIAITLSKGDVFENEIHITLTKKNISRSSILKFADIIDFLDLEKIHFILWADPKSSQKNKRRQISGKTRQNVLMRDNYTCQICGATVKDGAKLEIDHCIPVSKGGTNDENNLQVLCQQCNREKHNRTDLLHDKRKLVELQGK